MLAAAEPIAGDGGVLEVVLGLGVALVFAGVLVRALARRAGAIRRRSRSVAARTAAKPMHAAARVTADARGSPIDPPEPAVTRGTVLVDVCEPESRRLADDSLTPLAHTLGESRRLHAAEQRVAAELAGLDGQFWLVERDVAVGARRIPFLVLGATGVFAICPTDGSWTLGDLAVMSGHADHVRRQLPGYEGPVRGAVCLAFDDMRPRMWFGGESQQGRGGWLLGVDWLLPWMFGFGPEHGLGHGDVRHLHEAAGPVWSRRSSARLPVIARFG